MTEGYATEMGFELILRQIRLPAWTSCPSADMVSAAVSATPLHVTAGKWFGSTCCVSRFVSSNTESQLTSHSLYFRPASHEEGYGRTIEPRSFHQPRMTRA